MAVDQAIVIGDLSVNGAPNSSIPGAVPNSMLFNDENVDLAAISAPFVNANLTNTGGVGIDLQQRFDLGG